MIDCTSAVYVENEIKLSWPIWSGVVWDKQDMTTMWLNVQVQSMTKTRHDNDVTWRTSTICTENDIKLSWPMKSGVICDKMSSRLWMLWIAHRLCMTRKILWSLAKASSCYEQLKAIDDNNDSSSWAQGSRYYEYLRAMDDMNDFMSWVMSHGRYEWIGVMWSRQ